VWYMERPTFAQEQRNSIRVRPCVVPHIIIIINGEPCPARMSEVPEPRRKYLDRALTIEPQAQARFSAILSQPLCERAPWPSQPSGWKLLAPSAGFCMSDSALLLDLLATPLLMPLA